MSFSKKELEWAKAAWPGCSLIVLRGGVGAVFYEPSSSPSSRWEGRLLKSASRPDDVWWTAFCVGRTRGEVKDFLQSEV
jgi:hypothetical protein